MEPTMKEKDWEFIKKKLEEDGEIYRLLFLVRWLSGDGGSKELDVIMKEHRGERLVKMGLEDHI